MQFFRAELDGRLVAVLRVTEEGKAFRLSRSRPQWERSPELDRLARRLPGDLVHWAPVDAETAESAAAELEAISGRRL